MPARTLRRNRGPAAAPANRVALIASGRRLFAQQGYLVPLSAIARDAGVSQGVLYRHFPTRVSLAFAVFSENIDEIERLAADASGPDALGRIVGALVNLTVESAAFVDVVVDAADSRNWSGADRLVDLLRPALAQAQASGRARPDLDPDDILTLVRMVYGIVKTQGDDGEVPPRVLRAITLVDPLLASGISLHT